MPEYAGKRSNTEALAHSTATSQAATPGKRTLVEQLPAAPVSRSSATAPHEPGGPSGGVSSDGTLPAASTSSLASPVPRLQLSQPQPASAPSTNPTAPLDAFAATAKASGLTLSPAHPVLDRTFSAHPVVQAWLSSASGPPAGQAVQVEWQLLDARSAALSGSSSLWEPLAHQSPRASFPVQQPGDYQVTAEIMHGGRRLARVAAPLHVERSPDALYAATSIAPEARRAEQETRRSALADPSQPASDRKRLADERAILEFAAHEHGDPAPAMPDPGPDAVDFGAAQWGARAASGDQSWVVSTDPVFLRAMVEREYAKGGELAVLKLIGHMQRKANLARDHQGSPAEGVRLWRLGWDIASAMGQQYELLKQENAQFLADYERTARHVVDFTLTESEQRTLAEIAKYGLTREQVTDVVETGDGWNRKQRTVYGGGDTAGAKELAIAAAELVASQREIDTMRARVAKVQLDLFRAESPNILSPGQTRHPEQVGPLKAQLAALERKSAAAEAAHFSAAHQREQKFPVLTSYRKIEDHRVTFEVGKLEKLGGADARRDEIAPHLFGILDNIKKTREGLKPGGDLSIWKEDRVRQLTMPQMLIVPGSVRERAVLEKTAQEKRGGWGSWAIAALTVGLALLAAIPTGGSSLAVGVVAIAEVAGAALEVYLITDRLEEFKLQKAAAGTDMDKEARALSAEDPSLYWLALDMVLTGVSLGVAAKSFGRLRRIRDAAKTTKTTADLDDALAVIHAEHQAGHISADAAMRLDNEVMAANRTAHAEPRSGSQSSTVVEGFDSAGHPHAEITRNLARYNQTRSNHAANPDLLDKLLKRGVDQAAIEQITSKLDDDALRRLLDHSLAPSQIERLSRMPEPQLTVLWSLGPETLKRIVGILDHELDVLASLGPEILKRIRPLHAHQLRNLASLTPAELTTLAKLDLPRIERLSTLEHGELVKAHPFSEAAVDAKLHELASTETHVGKELRDSHTQHHLRETNFLDRGGLDNPGHAVRVSANGKPVAIEAPQYVRLEPAPAAAGAPPVTIRRIEVTALRHDNPNVVVTGDVVPNPRITAIDAPVPGNPYPKVTVETSNGSHAYTDVEKPPPGTRVAIKAKDLASSGFAGGHTRAAWDIAEKTYGDVVTKTGEQGIQFKLPGKPGTLDAAAIRAEVTVKPGTTKPFKDPKTIFERSADLDAFEAHARRYLAARAEALRTSPPPNNTVIAVDVPVTTTGGTDAVMKVEMPWSVYPAGHPSAGKVDIATWWLGQSNFAKGSAFNP